MNEVLEHRADMLREHAQSVLCVGFVAQLENLNHVIRHTVDTIGRWPDTGDSDPPCFRDV